MGYKAKVQVIERHNSRQFYITLPSACVQMMGFRKGEQVEWVLARNSTLMLTRQSSKKPDNTQADE